MTSYQNLTAEELSRLVLEDFPAARPRLKQFSTGAFVIDLEINGVPFAAEYIVGHGYGLSRTQEAVYGWEGVETRFETMGDLAHHIFKELAKTHS